MEDAQWFNLFLSPFWIPGVAAWIFAEINCFNYGKWLEWLLCEARIKTLGRFSAERGHKEGTWWRYPSNELHTQKVNLALALSLSYNTRTRGLVMKAKGSRMKAIKENKYLHKCIINLWREFPQERSEARSLVGFRRGSDVSGDNGNIWSCVGWCGKREGTVGKDRDRECPNPQENGTGSTNLAQGGSKSLREELHN